jgi:hypothetical protein
LQGSDVPIPDAVITGNDGVETAVEVEISVKKPDDLLEKIERLLPHYDRVWFFVPDDKGYRAVERARGKLDSDRRQQRVSVDKIDLSGMPTNLDE